MTKEQQDLAWACLPKEARDFIKSDGATAWQLAYARILGDHNLTSDTEPEELLLTPIKRAQQLYQEYKNLITPTTGAVDKAAYGGVLLALQELFGDKCLPDMTVAKNAIVSDKENTPKSGELKSYKEPSVQDEPKFKYNIGDLVTYKGKVKKVISRDLGFGGAIMYTCSLLNGLSPLRFEEESLEPYIEPKFKVGDKVIVKANAIDCSNHIGEITFIQEYGPDMYKVTITPCGSYILHVTDLEPYTEPETKDMEEKERNLCELLKDCEGESFYSPAFSSVTLKVIRNDRDKKPLYWEGGVTLFYTYADGRIYSDSAPMIFPNRALYEKYPLDAHSAWMEWKESRKPKP